MTFGVSVGAPGSDPASELARRGGLSLEAIASAIFADPAFAQVVANAAANAAGDAALAAKFPVQTSDIATNAVTAGKLATGAVTAAKLGSDVAASIGTTVTATKTAAYTATAGDFVPVNATSAAVAVTLPAATRAGDVVTAKKTDSSANPVTIAPGGSDTINGSGTSLSLTLQNQGATLRSNGAGAWLVQANDLPLGSLDSRLNATYVQQAAQTFTVLGDSLIEKGGEVTNSNGTNLNRAYAAAWPWALNLLGQPFDFVGNFGFGGDTTSSVLARVGDVIAAKPGIVHVLAGRNDINTGVATSTTIANLTAIWEALRKAGITVVAGTVPPCSSADSTQRAALSTINNFIRRQGLIRLGFSVADYEAALTDPSTSNYVSGYSTDGTHNDTPLGGYAGGVALANALRPLIVSTRDLPTSKADPANLLGTSGRFYLGDGSPAGGWQQAQYSVMPTSSAVARADGVYGNWRQLVVPSGDKVVLNVNIPIQANANGLGTSLAVGDVVEMLVEYEASSLDASASANTTYTTAKIQAYVGGSFVGSNMRYDLWAVAGGPNFPAATRTGVFRTGPLTIPASTSLVQALIELGGGGTYRLDRAVVRKMTPGNLAG